VESFWLDGSPIRLGLGMGCEKFPDFGRKS